MPRTKRKLTIQELRKLKFKMHSHLNGTGWSSRVMHNDDFRLAIVVRTDGRPHYRVTAKFLETFDGESLDLLLEPDARHAALEKFVEEYNAR